MELPEVKNVISEIILSLSVIKSRLDVVKKNQ